MGTAFDIFKGFFNTEGIFYINVYVVVFSVLIAISNILAYTKNMGNSKETFMNLDKFRNKLFFVIWICLIAMFAYVGDSAFIYAQF